MMTHRRAGFGLVVMTTAMFAAVATPACAQAQSEGDGSTPDWLLTVGGGAQLIPKYPGADKLRVAPLPLFGFRHDGDPLPFSAADQGASIGLLGNNSPINFGPDVQFQGARRNKDVGAPVGKVGFTVEAGAFVQAFAAPWLRLRAEGRRGIGGHRAWVGDLSADLIVRDDDRTIFSVGPRLRLGDGRYQRAYFGVSPSAAVATGLPGYRPGGGVYAAGLSSSITHQFSPAWGVRGYVGYDRLTGDAANSPIVRVYGSRDQFSGGLGLTYTFRVRRGGKARP